MRNAWSASVLDDHWIRNIKTRTVTAKPMSVKVKTFTIRKHSPKAVPTKTESQWFPPVKIGLLNGTLTISWCQKYQRKNEKSRFGVCDLACKV